MGLKWSLNGKYFNYFGVRVESSKGLIDKLKPRDRDSYTWAEYHGRQVNLSATKYESRDIVLTCWIKGDNVTKLTEQHNVFLSEFDKSGTQRLLVEPFGYKPFVFDVILMDKSELEKEFRDGEMFGKFTLTIQEPNPIKRILYTTSSQLSITYNSPTETDIIIDGTRYQGREVVNFTKNLVPRTVQSIEINGRNLFVGKLFLDGSDYPNASIREQGKIKLQTTSNFNAYAGATPTVRTRSGNKYIACLDVKVDRSLQDLKFTVFFEYPDNSVTINLTNYAPNVWHRLIFKSLNIVDPSRGLLIAADGKGPIGTIVEYKNLKVEIGENATDYSSAPEDQHYISIAGNIEDISNFTTNAEVLWDKI